MLPISVNDGPLSGALESSDPDNLLRPGSFADDYLLNNLVVGKEYFLGVSSPEFDAYLQLLNDETGEVIAEINDYGDKSSAQLAFVPEVGVNYIARVTSEDSSETGNYVFVANETIPVDLELSLLIDVSGSVNLTEYEQQIQGYVNVFDDPEIYNGIISQGLEGKIAVNFVLWASQQSEVVGWTLIDSAAASQQFAQTLRETLLPEFGGQRPFSGGTSSSGALDFADDLFFLNQFGGRRQAIEVSGDGNGDFSTSGQRDETLVNGIDVINGIVIGSSSAEDFYRDSLIGGTNADGTPAFVESASDFNEFGAVVRDVLIRELTPQAFFFTNDVSVQEGDIANPELVFTVSLSRASEQATSIDFATQDGTARAGSDFVAASGTLTFAPGETSKTVAISVIDDSRLEIEESFSLVLSNAVNADLRQVPGIGAIADNDNLQLSSAIVDENSSTGTLVGTVAATDPSDPDPFTYSLLNDAGGRFALVGDQLQVANGSLLDFETNSSHNITVRAVDSSGNIFDETFTISVLDGSEGPLLVTISAPNSIDAAGTGFVTVTYTNIGDEDLSAPLLDLSATGAQFTPLNSTEFTEESIQFLGINNEGLAGVLPVGASNSFTVEFQPTVTTGQIDFAVSTVNPDEFIDWAALQGELKPDYLTDEAWNDIYGNFTAVVGNTAGEYEQLLIQNANYLSEQGEYVPDANRLVGFEFQQASDYQAIAQRSSLGSFGRGRFFIGDIQAVTDADGNVAIVNSGTQRSFTLRGDGTYDPAQGDYGILTLENGVYTLTEQSGTATVFNTSGQLDFIEDTNGNRITGQYTGDQLTGLVATNGDSLSFTRNATDLISTVTDSAGRTTSYTYDGELLTGVTSPEGTTTYAYNEDFALTSITDGNGVQASFEYDDRGRLIRESFNGGIEAITYSYGENGEVTVTDLNGAATQLFLNDRGQVTQLTDALGRSLRIRYDQAGNATSIIAPDGSTLSFNYDDEGNLLNQVNPLGQSTSFTYEPNFDSLASVTDPRGNALSYSYDEAGNLTAIAYADGSSESFSYDDEGNVTQSINRRGQGISYSYNNRGQLLRQDNADGSFLAYTYDVQGNLTSATDSNGTTTLAYDSGNRLTNIIYANGRSLTYTYDVGGRRTGMTDGEGNQVNYSYDVAGRLAGLTDGDANPIVAYTYDEAGRLAREDNGNGTFTTYAYDEAGQLISIFNFAPDNSVNSSFVYGYDELGQQTGVTTLDGVWTYSYDGIGQLTGAVFTSTNANIPNQDLSYEYDAAGNRIRTVVNGETTNYTTNTLNQYETAGAALFNYDADGNLISKTEAGNTWTYEYNNENRLVRVVDSAGIETRYEYDALGNRTATVYDGERTEYLVDPFGLGDVVAEYDSTGGLVAQYTHGIGLVSRNEGGASAFYDSNAIGSTVGLTDAAGAQINSYNYLPFGGELAETEAIVNPFEFVGQWGVMEEANGLDFMRARFYSEEIGRFISTDPIGFIGSGANLYQYGVNNPLSFVDPQGLSPAQDLVNSLQDFRDFFSPGGCASDILGALSSGSSLAAAAIAVLNPPVAISFTAFSILTGLGSAVLSNDFNAAIDSTLLGQGINAAGAVFDAVSTFPKIGGFAGPLFDLNNIANQFDDASDCVGDFFRDVANDIGDEISDLVQDVANGITSILDNIIPDFPNNQGRSKGEPHISTFDGAGYSFQAAGEFTLVESDDLNIQVRYIEIDPRATVASAVATEVEGQVVVIDSEGVSFEEGRPTVSRGVFDDGSGPTITIDNEVITLTDGGEVNIGNSRLYRRGSEYTIVYAGDDGVVNDGDEQLSLNYFRPGTINIVDVFLDDGSKGQVQGLLGNLNDDPADDIALPDGTIFSERPLNFTDIYGDFREAWRVKTIDESLFRFNYQFYSGIEGVDLDEGPNIFFNPNFPVTKVDFTDLTPEEQERGVQAALAAGYDPADVFEFESAAFDFAVISSFDEELAAGFLQGVETDPGADPIRIINNGNLFSAQVGDGSSITVNRTGDLSGTSTITIKLPDGTLLPITFAPGETSQDIDISQLGALGDGEFIVEPDPDNPGGTRLRFVRDDGVDLIQDLVTGFLATTETPDNRTGCFQVTLLSNNTSQLYELGVFTVDDPTGLVDGIAPGEAGYTQAVLARSQVVVSTLGNPPNGFDTSLLRTLDLPSGQQLRFYLLPESTTDAIKAGVTSIGNLIIATPETLEITEATVGAFNLDWNLNPDNDEPELTFQISDGDDFARPVGTTLQGQTNGEVLDLRDTLTGQPIQAQFTIHREAKFDNTVGLYAIADEFGGIDLDGDGAADVTPGEAGYKEAALAGRIQSIDLRVDNKKTKTVDAQLSGGSIFAPFIIVDGTIEDALDGSEDVYFAFLGANSDGADHIRLLGDNTFGFEDLPGGGDQDFNDLVVQATLVPG